MTITAGDYTVRSAPPSVATSHPTIAVEGLTVRYGAQPVLADVSFALPAGQLVGVIGPNGAGKTTLLKAILGLVPRVAGIVTVGGAPVVRRGGRIAYVAQRDTVNWRFPASVLDVVLMGRYSRLGWLHRPAVSDRALAQRCLGQVGMEAYASRAIADLSGGQQQRVFLARALAQEPDVLLLDEPISGVDAPTQEAILEILQKLAAQGKTVLLTTHDLRFSVARVDMIMALNRRVVALGPAGSVLTPQVLAATYGTQLMLSDGTGVTLLGEN